ncbi:hypothetical protein Tco_0810691 [Tanacetum coccineum]
MRSRPRELDHRDVIPRGDKVVLLNSDDALESASVSAVCLLHYRPQTFCPIQELITKAEIFGRDVKKKTMYAEAVNHHPYAQGDLRVDWRDTDLEHPEMLKVWIPARTLRIGNVENSAMLSPSGFWSQPVPFISCTRDIPVVGRSSSSLEFGVEENLGRLFLTYFLFPLFPGTSGSGEAFPSDSSQKTHRRRGTLLSWEPLSSMNSSIPIFCLERVNSSLLATFPPKHALGSGWVPPQRSDTGLRFFSLSFAVQEIQDHFSSTPAMYFDAVATISSINT